MSRKEINVSFWVLSLAVLLLAMSFATGCGGMNKPAVTKRYYDISPQRQAALQATVSGPVLTVRRLRVSPMNAGRELVYRTSDTGYSSDFYHAYFIPPADMLSQALRQWLHSSGLFAQVVEPGSLVRGDLVLEGNVVALYGDFAGGGTNGGDAAVAEVQFLLLDEGGAETKVVFSKDYARRIPLASSTPGALASGLKRAASEIYAQLEGDLAAAVRK